MWELKKLKEIALVTAGQSPEGKYYNSEGNGMPFYQGKKEFTDKYIGNPVVWTSKVTKIAKEGDVLMSVRAPVGPVNFATQECCIGRGLASIRVLENFDRDFLLYFFKNVENTLVGNAGAVFNSINKSQIEEIKIPIPPLEEQQKIVEKLDKAFELIDQAKANIEQNIINAKELFQSKLDEVFSQKGDGWMEMNLGELGKVSMCKRILKNQTSPEGDIPFYKIGTFGKKPDAYISKELFDEYSSKYSYPNKGQILLSASGTIGRTVVFDGRPSFFQDSNIVWIDNKEGKVLNSYLFHFYKVCNWNPSKGATISRLYNDDLKRIKISFPDIEDQKKLIPIMENLELQTKSLITKYENKLFNLEELRKSILEKAFKGELTH